MILFIDGQSERSDAFIQEPVEVGALPLVSLAEAQGYSVKQVPHKTQRPALVPAQPVLEQRVQGRPPRHEETFLVPIQPVRSSVPPLRRLAQPQPQPQPQPHLQPEPDEVRLVLVAIQPQLAQLQGGVRSVTARIHPPPSLHHTLETLGALLEAPQIPLYLAVQRELGRHRLVFPNRQTPRTLRNQVGDFSHVNFQQLIGWSP